MNVKIIINGTDVTGWCLLSATRISFDSSKRITTASITLAGQALNAAGIATYDATHYGAGSYSFVLRELFEVVIIDGRDGVTKLFDGQVYTMTLKQSDTKDFSIWYQADLNDWAAFLDRAICWDPSFQMTLPNSDQYIIAALIQKFCPRILLGDIHVIVPVVESFDWLTKTCRQILDDLCTLSGGEWRVDFDRALHYQLASTAPPAPFGLSTSPNFTSTFPVKVDGYKHDFSNPINRAYVRGNIDPTLGIAISATYSDPVSVSQYGEYATGLVDDQIVTGWDAALKAKSLVLQGAWPLESGNFTIWGPDGLAVGMQIHIVEENLGIDGDYIIRQLVMQWEDADQVRYQAQFGEMQPDLEATLRLMAQRIAWKTSAVGSANPLPGSVGDGSIKPPGLSAGSIGSVNAGTIIGVINAGQIGSVNANTIIGTINADQIGTINAGSIVGVISASQIGSVNAAVIQGVIQAGQIGSVNATSIQGVISATQIGSVNATSIQGAIVAGQIQSVNATTIAGVIQAGQIGAVNATVIQGVVVSSQLADGIVDSLSKYSATLTPTQIVKKTDPFPPALPSKNFPPNSFFYNDRDGHFYQINAAGNNYTLNDSPANTQTTFYYLGQMSATSITGLIAAGQIGSITATQITGQIQSAQINTVTATQITGQLTATQVASITASQITGQLNASQINTITAGQITGQINATQISAVNASVIAGQITATQISTVNATAIQGSIAAANITAVNATAITGTLSSTQIGSINAATITIGLIQDGQISTINGGKIIAGTVSTQQLNTTGLDVGGQGSMPGSITVWDNTLLPSPNKIAFIGKMDTVPNYGGWFKVFGAGGTQYTDAKVKTDVSGNLSINDATLTINNNSTATKITTGPAIFDSTYQSISFNVQTTNSTDNSMLISRGLVVKYGSNVVLAVVRDPNTAAGGAIDFPNGAPGCYITMSSGPGGGIRSDNGFGVQGYKGYTGIFTAGALSVTVRGGIITSVG